MIRESSFLEDVISMKILVELAYSTMVIKSAPVPAAYRTAFSFPLYLQEAFSTRPHTLGSLFTDSSV